MKGSSPRLCPGQGCSQGYKRLLKAVSVLSSSKNQLCTALWELVRVLHSHLNTFPFYLLGPFPAATYLIISCCCVPLRDVSLCLLHPPPTGHLSIFLSRVTKSSSFSLSLYIRGNVLMTLSNVTFLSRNLERIKQLKPENSQLYEFL